MNQGGEDKLGQLRRAARLYYGILAALLAIMTGIGLVSIAGVRSPSSWALFALASIAAVVVPRTWIRADRSEISEDSQLRGSAEHTGKSVEAHRGNDEPRSDRDEVDYLKALRHELRTPLNAVLGFADVLLSEIDGEVNASQREDLEIIRASGIRLRILLDSALDISQLADGALRLDLETVDVRDVVLRAVSEAEQLWSNKRTIHCTLPAEACLVDADEARVRRSILVLADVLATSHHEAEIHVGLKPSGDHLAIEVRAEGEPRSSLDPLPTMTDVLAAEDPARIRQWPVAVTSELIERQGGFLYQGAAPSRFLIRLARGGAP